MEKSFLSLLFNELFLCSQDFFPCWWQISYFTYSFFCLTCNILSCSCNISSVHKVSFSRPIKRIHNQVQNQALPTTAQHQTASRKLVVSIHVLQLSFLQILFLLYANICFIRKFSDPNAPTKKFAHEQREQNCAKIGHFFNVHKMSFPRHVNFLAMLSTTRNRE